MPINLKDGQVTLGLGMLSWRAPKTVDHTLASYAERGFPSLFDHCQIFFQEITGSDRAVAEKYGFDTAGNSSNRGIYGGVKALLESMSDDYVLFVENDCVLIENRDSAEKQLAAAVRDIDAGRAAVYRFRHLRRPGEDFATVDKYLRYYPAGPQSWINRDRGSPFMSFVRRLLRPAKARRLAGIAAYVELQPEMLFPDVFTRTADNNLIVSSRHLTWTNQAVLFRRRWVLDEILPGWRHIPAAAP